MLPFERKKRIVKTKKRAKTDPKFGCNPEERSVAEMLKYGIVNVNKPPGPTSHQVSAYVKKILKIKKAGHSGTLDPKVTGVLPVAFERSTRIVDYLLRAGKEYIAIMHVHKDIAPGIIYNEVKKFVGKITQLPPIKSAVKRQEREREIYYLKIIEVEGRDVLFKVGCQAGTYVRKLIHDIGLKLGTRAHMSGLIRTRAGPFKTASTVTLQDLKDAFWYYEHENNEKFIRQCIQPVEKGVEHLAKVWLVDTAVNTICHGAGLSIPGIAKYYKGIQKGDDVAMMTLKDELIAVGKAMMTSEQIEKEEKGLVIKSNKVFMRPGTYPKLPSSSE